MAENTDTPLMTDEQFDFIVQDLRTQHIHDMSKLPAMVEGETTNEWFERAIQAFYTYEGNHTSTYLRNVRMYLNGETSDFSIGDRYTSTIPDRYNNFPTGEPRPRGMATTSKDHRVRIDQWMEHLGKADQAQVLVDKYGLDVAYAICQQSMLQPANMKDITGGTMLGSRDAVQYFLDNDVSADNLAKIPGLNAEIVEASLQSVRPEPEIEKVEPVELTPLPDVELKTPQPTAEQISLDEQRVLLAATLKNDLQLANIPQDRVDLAINMAFARSLESDSANFGEWAFNFRQDLIQNLGGEKAFERNEADYNQLCTTFAEAQTAVAEGNVPDDVSAHTASFEGVVKRNNLHLDLAGMEPSTPILTSEMYRQTRRFNNKMERRAERDAKKAERDAKRADELGITVEELHQRRDERKENWNNFVDKINPFNGREQ